jgi:integrase
LANTKLRNVTKAHIYDMFNALRKNAIGGHALQLVYKVLHRAFAVAVEEEKLDRNVVALVKKPPAANRERCILRTEDEIVRFHTAVKGSVYETLYLVALDTGCRQGELLALTWDCVDLTRGLIYIKATLTRNDAGELIATPPKTASSVRAVRLTANTIQLLKAHRKQRMDPKSVQSAWVFPNWDGGPMRKDGYIRREFARLMKAAKLPKLTFHSLRHTHATILAALGVPMKATQERLGHSTTRMTMEVYSHATAAMQDHLVTALDEFYRHAGQKPEAISGQISGQTAKSDSTDQTVPTETLTG